MFFFSFALLKPSVGAREGANSLHPVLRGVTAAVIILLLIEISLSNIVSVVAESVPVQKLIGAGVYTVTVQERGLAWTLRGGNHLSWAWCQCL